MPLTNYAETPPGLTLQSRGRFALDSILADGDGVVMRLESGDGVGWVNLILTRGAIAALLAMTDARPAATPTPTTPTPAIPCPPARIATPDAGDEIPW